MAYSCVVCEKNETVRLGSACPDCLHDNLLRVQYPCERCGRSYPRRGGDKGRCGSCHYDEGGDKPWVKMDWLLYVLRCKDKTLYCGITNDLPSRLYCHNEGKGAKYTRPKTRRPVSVVYTCPYPNRSKASKAEHAFKKLSKAEKEKLMRNYKP